MLVAQLGNLRLLAMRLVGRWYLIPLILFVVFVVSWPLMWLAEPALAGVHDYYYWFYVTVTTIGYGDLSPQTDGGRLVFCLVATTGVAMYGLFIGQIGNLILTLSQRRRKGLVNVQHLKNHVVLYGYDAERTPPLVAELSAKGSFDIALVDSRLAEHPFPDLKNVHFKLLPVMDANLVAETAAVRAKSVIIDTGDDAQAVVLARRLRRQCADLRVVVALSDLHYQADLADLDGVTCLQRRLERLLAREAVDSGVSQVINDLMSSQDGSSDLMVVTVPDAWAGLTMEQLQIWLKRVANAVVMGLKVDGQQTNNPAASVQLVPGSTLFYADRQPLPAVALERPNL